MKKIKCKECKLDFHYCSNCDYDKYCYEGYCGKECYEKSFEFKTFSNNVKKLWNSLNENQQHELWTLWDNGIFLDDKWEYFLDEIIINPIKN